MFSSPEILKSDFDCTSTFNRLFRHFQIQVAPNSNQTMAKCFYLKLKRKLMTPKIREISRIQYLLTKLRLTIFSMTIFFGYNPFSLNQFERNCLSILIQYSRNWQYQFHKTELYHIHKCKMSTKLHCR